MNDLLGDSIFHEFQKSSYAVRDIEMGEAASEKELENFHFEADKFKGQFQRIDGEIKNLKKLNEKVKTVIGADELKAARNQVDMKIVEIKALFASMAMDLNRFKIKYCTVAAEKKIGRQGYTILNSFNKMLMTEKKEFLGYLKEIDDELRQMVKLRLQTVSELQTVDDKTVDEIIYGGDADNVYKAVLMQRGGAEIENLLNEIQGRHQEVLDMEQDLLQLNQAFLDMAVLVHSQGDMLNSIETHVGSASKFVKAGNAGLEKSKKLQKNSRKWMCYAIILLLLVIVVVVVGVVKPWTSKNGA